MPQVSIIVVNYSGEKYIVDCLKAIKEQRFSDFDTIVVDNASLDDSLEVLDLYSRKSSSPLFEIVPLKENVGFAGGCLEGFKRACGSEYIALLNNDTEVDAGWLGELIKVMESNPAVGICGSKMIVRGTEILDSAGDGFSKALRGFKRGEGEQTSSYTHTEYVFGTSAGAALYRREMIEEIGFLDEDFFLIHEDTDLNLRAQLYGWKVQYVPTAIVYHKVRSSIGKMSDTAVYYTLRNSEFVRIKNVPTYVIVRCFPEVIIGILTEFLYFGIKRKRLGLYLKAKIDAIKMLPKMLKKRASIVKNRKVKDEYLLSMMTPLWQKQFLRTKMKKFLYD